MEDREIEELFFSVAENAGETKEEVRKVFFALIRSTLRYRDHLLDSEGITLTVKDVQIVLDWLVPTLNTGKYPETENKIGLDLLKIWIDELKII